MHFRKTVKELSTRTLTRLESIERAADTLYDKLVAERRWFVVLSAAVGDFWKQKMYYFTGYFTYNAFLALLALIIGLAAAIGFIIREFPSSQPQIADALRGLLPVIGGTPKQATEALTNYRNVLGVIGVLGLLWTGSRIFGALEWGFANIWGTKKRSFAKGKILGMLMVSVIGAAFITSLAVQFGFAAVWGWAVGKGGTWFTVGTTIVRPLMALAVNFVLFLFIYQVVPTAKQKLKLSAVGALVSAVFFLAVQYLLAFYFGHISGVPSQYGAIATGVVLIVWLHITGMITFMGAEIIHALYDEELVEAHKREAKLPKLFKTAPAKAPAKPAEPGNGRVEDTK